MSADRIGETCPSCNEPALREYFHIGFDDTDSDLLYPPELRGPLVIRVRYRVECKECTYSYVMPSLTLEAPRRE